MDCINKNIGCVIYTETTTGLKAEWICSKNEIIEQGIGVGIRLTALNNNRFEGEYEIIYTDAKGSTSPKIHLIISLESGVYNLLWKINGKTTDMGIGIERDNKLFASYTAII